MHRIDTDGPPLPPSPTPGYFEQGDPLVPRLPTQVDHHWLNAVQEELVNAILGAGLALAKGTNTQLKKALGLLGPGGSAGPGDRWFTGRQSVDAASGTAISGTTGADGLGDEAGVAGQSELANGVKGTTTDGVGVRAVVTAGGTGVALAVEGPSTYTAALGLDGVVDPGSSTPIQNQIFPGLVPKAWLHFAWNNGAPAVSGTQAMNIGSISTPGTGQVQLTLASGITGSILLAGMVGPGARYMAPNDVLGKFTVYDSAGAAVNFNASSGFGLVVAFGFQ